MQSTANEEVGGNVVSIEKHLVMVLAIVLTICAGVNLYSLATDPGSLGQNACAKQPPHAFSVPVGYDNPQWSPNGKYILLSDAKYRGVYLYCVETSSLLEITDAPSSGYQYFWSPDSTKVGFKLLIEQSPSIFKQVPVLYDLGRKKIVKLAAATEACGIPSFSKGGKIAFSVGDSIWILSPELKVLGTFAIDTYANLTPISPDGRKVVYNDDSDQIWLLDLKTGQRTCLTDDNESYFQPKWSPDSRKIAVNTLSGKLKVIDIEDHEVFDLGYAGAPTWSQDSAYVLFSRVKASEKSGEVIAGDLYAERYDGSGETAITRTENEIETSPDLALTGQLAFRSYNTGDIFIVQPQGRITPSGVIPVVGPPRFDFSTLEKLYLTKPRKIGNSCYFMSRPETNAAMYGTMVTKVTTPDGPYIHQVYDTPNAFDGRWACSATSALMAITYYGILPEWPCTVSIPYAHTSPFGRYVSDVYSYNGHTYNIWGCDASQNPAYGGYGYIVRQRWCTGNSIVYPHTSEYLSDYLANHGLTSSVDWSPSWAKFQTEIDYEYPVVLLTKLTSSGHYVLGKGYYTNRTVVTNDPYGNANQTYMNYNGENALYDWPGYNNGHVSLMRYADGNPSSPYLFVYARGTPSQAPPSVETRDATNTTATAATLNAQITDDGGASIDERRFSWGTTSSCSDGWVTDNPGSDHYGDINSSGSYFSYRLSGLTPNTAYYFQAWAHNSAGWGHSTAGMFTTPSQITPHVSVSPAGGPAGTQFSVRYTGFTPNSTLTSHLQKPDGSEFRTLTLSTNNQGDYVSNPWLITSDTFVPGTYTLWGVDDTTGISSGRTSFVITLSPPTGVSASDGTYADKVHITWNSVNGASYYRVYRATSSGGTKTALGSWQTSRSYDDTSVTPGTTYYYWVKAATDSSGSQASDYSPYDTGWAKEHTVSTPSTPSGPSSGCIGSSLSFSTGGATDSLGHSVQYRFDWGDGHYSSWSSSASGSHSYGSEGAYQVKAQARCSVDTSIVSGWSSAKAVTISGPPSAPSNVQASDGTYSNKVHITWNSVSGATRYEVYRASSSGGSYSQIASNVTGTSYDDTSVTAGQHYWYKVKACNGCGCSGYSSANEGWAGNQLAFVTDKDTVTVPEGGTATFRVKLSAQPASTVQATVSRASGDSDISVSGGSSLTFTTSNWDSYQTVTLAAAEDTDTTNGTATIRIHRTSGDSVPDKDITATEQDNDQFTGCWQQGYVTIQMVGSKSDGVKFGVDPAGSECFDNSLLDVEQPPSPNPPYTDGWFELASSCGNTDRYMKDTQGSIACGEVRTWTLKVTDDGSATDVTLSWDQGQLPTGGCSGQVAQVTLLDKVTGDVTDMRAMSSYTYTKGSNPETREFEIKVDCSSCNSICKDLTPVSWHMITVPGDLCGACASGGYGDLVCALLDDLSSSYIFRYDPTLGRYVMVPPRDAIRYVAGMGFWVRTYQEVEHICADIKAKTEKVCVPVKAGWNQIGDPFNFRAALSSVTVKYQGSEISLQQAVSDGVMSGYLFSYDPVAGHYEAITGAGVLEPWTGYWVRVYKDCEICIPPTAAPSPPGPPGVNAVSVKELELRGVPIPPGPPSEGMASSLPELLGIEVRNIPNPIRSEHTTTFKVEGKGAELVQAIKVEIYNQAGQRVFTQDINAKELEWHTNNDAGELLANGVYLYQVWVKIAGEWYPTGVHKLAVIR